MWFTTCITTYIVGLRTQVMPQGLLVLPRMSPACSVVVVYGGNVIGGVASEHLLGATNR